MPYVTLPHQASSSFLYLIFGFGKESLSLTKKKRGKKKNIGEVESRTADATRVSRCLWYDIHKCSHLRQPDNSTVVRICDVNF